MNDCKDDNSLGRLIYFAAQEMSNFAEKVLKPHNLTLEQFHLLKSMPPDGQGLTQRELGEVANKKPANMTRILDRLENKELVTRRDNPEDRRVVVVCLTEKGRELIATVHGGFEVCSSRFVSGVTENEQEITRKVMQNISQNLKEMTDELSKS